MKRTALFFVLFGLLVACPFSLFAQKGRRPFTPPAVADGQITYDRVDAVSEGQGVYIRWATGVEVANLGFNVFRITPEGRQQVNPGLITGSAFRRVTPGHSGEEYFLYDPSGDTTSIYLIENTFLGGHMSGSQPFSVRQVKSLLIEIGISRADLEIQAASHNGDVLRNNLDLDKELQEVVTAAQPEPDLNVHRWVVSQPGAKISVRFDGFYRVTRAQLEAAGFNVNANPANWRLFMEGIEQAIRVGGNGDYIEFFGRGRDTRESDTRVYYLLADATAGKRIENKIIRNVGGTVLAKSYRSSLEFRDRRSYNGMIINGDQENYFGRAVTSGTMELLQLQLNGVDTTAATATIRVKLQPIQGTAHNVRVEVNGNLAGFITGGASSSYQGTLTIPASFLVEGLNNIDLREDNTANANYLDTVEITYSRLFQAAGDKLSYFTPGYRKADVGGFSTSNIRVFDTTYAGVPQEITGLSIVQNGGTFTAKLPSYRAMVMYAVENSAFLSPASVTFNNPSTLATRMHQGQYLIITHSAPDFVAAANQWSTYRASQAGGGYLTAVVDIADIFDEFGYGSSSSAALQSFLEFTLFNWQVPPNYVLLLGDSSYDPRNYEGFGNWNLIPTKFVNLLFEESGSDEALADFNHDGLAEIPIGRIPARSGFFVTSSLNKTMGFETPANQNLNRGGLYVYDIPSGFDFLGMSVGLRNEMPASMPSVFVSRGLPPPDQMIPDPQGHTNLISALNTGKYIVNFAGHGSPGVWGSLNFFNSDDPPLLTNGASQSIFTMLTCYNGVFFRPNPVAESVSERLLFAQNGGGAVTWASTTETTPDLQFTMGARFFDEVGNGNITRMGDLVKISKSTIPASDVGYSWVLLGDPALKIR